MGYDEYTSRGVPEGSPVVLHLVSPDDTDGEEKASGRIFRDKNNKYWISDISGERVDVPDDPKSYHLHPAY